MPLKSLTPEQSQQILADPNVQAIMHDPRYSTPMLRDAAVNQYLANDPRSPFRGWFGAEANLRSDGVPAGGLHFNPATGGTDYTNTYGHPGTMKAVGLGSVAAGGALSAAGLLPGLGGAAASAAPSATTAVPSMPWTIPAGFEASMGAAPLGSVAAGAGGAAGAAGAGAAGAAKGIGGGLLDQLTSGKSLAGLAGLIASLVAGRGNGVGDATAAFNQQYPQLNQLLDMSAQRAQRTDPLHQAVTQLAMSRLPTNVQR